ncbi:hypothetical protein ANN_21214 [Periplaneta americana]|uniref:Reverse transcriptase domain-containing protein n=1 Tax=Periplaneta americana TaxID=6978 RepID=A0ABQ8SFW5_PERAM|nr:hypothetical protein ANN_21214 [Periplaneta americana]
MSRMVMSSFYLLKNNVTPNINVPQLYHGQLPVKSAKICRPSVKMYIYADDMVLGSTDREELQESIHNLASWANKNGFDINPSKTMQMVFRMGGRQAEEDLRTKFLLPATTQEAALKEERQQKRNEVPNDFYATDAMTDRSWTGPNNKIRSAVTRLAVHGYHHKLCKTSNYHDPPPECVCKLCDKPCARYHFKREREGGERGREGGGGRGREREEERERGGERECSEPLVQCKEKGATFWNSIFIIIIIV